MSKYYKIEKNGGSAGYLFIGQIEFASGSEAWDRLVESFGGDLDVDELKVHGWDVWGYNR